MTKEDDEPTVLDTEDSNVGEDGENESSESSIVKESANIHATRDDVIAESQAVNSDSDDDDEDDDEINSARGTLEDGDLDDDETGDSQESEDDTATSAYDRMISKVNGAPGKKFANLRTHLTGKIVLSVADEKEGYTFDWSKEELQVEKWNGKRPKDHSCLIELSSKNLEQILRGRLNPQIAMLSHKVTVSGEFSQAVYLFNLFGSSR